MKIAYVYDAVYPWVKGGAEMRVWEISRRLVERGHEVHLFGVKWWDGKDTIERDGVYLHGICRVKNLYTKNGNRSIKEALYFGCEVFKPLLKKDFDIIDVSEFPYFSCFSSKAVSTWKKESLVVTWHEVWDDYWYEYMGTKGIFGKIIERAAARLTDNIIAVSKSTKNDLERIGVRTEIEIIPNGIDFGKIERIRASDLESDIIFTGRLIREKNVNVLIKAVSLVSEEFPDVRCVIIGDGPERRELEKLVLDLGLGDNIEFIGFLEDYDDVISHMKSSKVFVLPSTREGFGIAALEANACGLPVVTVNHGRNAACDFINNGNGFICELSEGDVAEKILRGLSERKSMGRRCIERAKGYDWDGIVVDLRRMYEGLV